MQIDTNLINLEDIKSNTALIILGNYTGINPYLRKMRDEYRKNNTVKLTETQVKYIMDNHEKEPILINRVIAITAYLGAELQRQEGLSFVPEKVLIEYILGDNDKSYHIQGKLKQNQKVSKLYFLPKTQVLDDPYYEKINFEVDFTQYNDILAKFGKQLYQHQKEGVKFLLSRDGCILADDMGLAKTMQSIIAALEIGAKKILVICPSSVKINWRREIEVFCEDITIVDSKKWNSARFTIINYDILKNFHTVEPKRRKGSPEPIKKLNRHIVDSNFDLMIVDEAHYLKNNKSIRGEIVADLITHFDIEKVWLLTGTPIANRPMDFFNLLKIIRAPMADNWQYFARRYCDAKKIYTTLKNGEKRQVWLTDGASNLDELALKSKNIILRRLKTDVLDLPDKIVTPMYHELSAKAKIEYNSLWEDYVLKRREQKKRVYASQKDLIELSLLRQFIAMQAIPETIEMTENALDMGKKVVIFTNFNDELKALAEHFGKLCVTHHGSMTDNAKQRSIDGFQNNDKIKIFIGNQASAGVGITLTKGTVVIFNSFDWVPGNHEQCEDRCMRIGQTEIVNVYYQVFEDTISTRMLESVRNKKEVISAIIEPSEDEIMQRMIDKIIDNE